MISDKININSLLYINILKQITGEQNYQKM